MSKKRLVEVRLLDRLLDIVAEEGLVDRVKLEPTATLDEAGLTMDDLILIANKIEREFDRDLLHDEELESVQTVGGLLDLIATRITISSDALGESAPYAPDRSSKHLRQPDRE
ncbi:MULTISPECIES: hypothetical protein [unclassified Bosea (in: a-proteobacteria)]|uniref:hypothetical protein n=1 Tax=unclassified Bosea (in: a-proteobacteria) TaxID=2653178 RepID=UPI000F7EBCEB|nr:MULTISPECIES: hypothetical protein [unclassified Bosea (in: a-proteobacteria)]MCV9937136.1 hypothetical protein [Boseaceae bacterium BT-24-1]